MKTILDEIHIIDYKINDIIKDIQYSSHADKENILNLFKLTSEKWKLINLLLSSYKNQQNYIEMLLIKKDYFVKEKYFDCDIIISSPYNIINSDEDWENSWHGIELRYIGINENKYIVFDADDSCHNNFEIINTVSDKTIGNFHTDEYSLIGIFSLDEILKYNSDVLSYNNKIIIKNFNGIVKSNHDENGNFQITGTGNTNFLVRKK